MTKHRMTHFFLPKASQSEIFNYWDFLYLLVNLQPLYNRASLSRFQSVVQSSFALVSVNMAMDIQKRQRAQLFNTTKELKSCVLVRLFFISFYRQIVSVFLTILI